MTTSYIIPTGLKLPPHLQRVRVEADWLRKKMFALSKFISTDTFDQLPKVEQVLLTTQEVAMRLYYMALDERIGWFISTHKDTGNDTTQS